MIYPEYDGKGHIPELIVYDGGYITIIIHEGKKVVGLFLKCYTIPYPRSTDNSGLKIVQTIIKRQLEGGEKDKWDKIVNTCMVFSEENFTGVHRMYTMENTGTNHQN